MTENRTPERIIAKTPEGDAALAVIVNLIAPFMYSTEQASALANAIADFTEQAIRDDRARIKAILWDEVEGGWIEQPVIDLIAKLGLDG